MYVCRYMCRYVGMHACMYSNAYYFHVRMHLIAGSRVSANSYLMCPQFVLFSVNDVGN